jgi:hypothetical protein
VARHSVTNWPPNKHGLHLQQGDCLLNVKLLDLNAAYTVNVRALDPMSTSDPVILRHLINGRFWIQERRWPLDGKI